MQPTHLMGDSAHPRKRSRNRPRKAKGREGLVVDDKTVAALKAMHRCRDLTVLHIQAAMGLRTVRATRKRLRDMERQKLIHIVEPKPNGGARYHQHSITDYGFEILCDELAGNDLDPDEIKDEIGAWSKPPKRVWSKFKLKHRNLTADAVVAAERSILKYPGWGVRRAIPEFRRNEFTGEKYPTADLMPNNKRLKFDAIVLVEDTDDPSPERYSRLIAVEVDVGGESISSVIDKKLREFWDWLQLGRARDRFDASDPITDLVFITKSRVRIDNILAAIAWETFPETWIGEQKLDPSDVFHFTTHEDAKADFFGAHWQVPNTKNPAKRFALLETEVADVRAA